MSWKVSKQFHFEAAHVLPHHDGKCARLHGHSWKASIVVAGNALQAAGPKAGMLMDFADIAEIVEPLRRDYLDHHYLNETTGLESPTSEELARWIFEQAAPLFDGLLQSVVVEETCTSRAEYTPMVSDPS